jgi:hypothetical protein
MATVSKTVPAQSGDIQLAAQTYQQSMQDLSAVVSAKASESGVVILQPGQLSVVQVQAGKQYKLRKSGNPNQTPDDLIAVRHGDALHVRYADGSVVHFEDFYSTCTDSSVCSVNLASDSASGATLSADTVNAGPAADDGLLVYAHGNPDVLMSMAQQQSGLSAALESANTGSTLTYAAPSPYLGMGALALMSVGALSVGASATTANSVNGEATNAEQATALRKIGTAAGADNASGTATVAALTRSDYTAAGVNGVTDGNVAAINSALDTSAVTTDKANSASKLQTIVDAYKAVLASADGTPGNTATALTGEQYAAIGVSGVPAGSPAAGGALKLLDEMVDKSAAADVDTVTELQAKADAALHLIAAAGGTAAEAAKLTVADLLALGINNATADNIGAIRAAIQATKPDTAIDELGEVKAIVDTAVAGVANALVKISNAAGVNNASGSGSVAALTVDDYAKAGVSGVTAANVGAINKALDSVQVTADKADTTAEVQTIVNAYAAVLASADGTASNTATALTGEQYAAIGVTGVPTGSPTEGGFLKLLDDTVDKSVVSDVSTVTQLQAMADAAAHVLAAAGGTAADAAKLTLDDLKALGIAGVTADTIIAIRTAILNTSPDTAIDQQTELTAIVNGAIAGIATELGKISKAAGANNASGSSGVAALGLDDYSKANVSGLTAGNVASINSALDTAPITAEQANTTAKVQAVVDAYTSVLASADGTGGNTSTALTGAQYNAIGVTGVNAVASEGTALFLLNNVVDQSAATAVDTASEVQALATAAAHVIGAAAGGSDLTVQELGLLGITGVTDANIAVVRAAIAATLDNGIEVDTRQELQAVADKVTNASGMVLHTVLGGTTNLDVTSNLVFTADRTVSAGTGFIHLTDMGGTGFHGDTSTNNQTIDISTAISQGLVSIVGTGTSTTIIINPKWDLDLSSNYQVSFDAGVFVDAQGHSSAAMPAVSFSTVKPGGHGVGTALSEAVASQTMSESTGALVAGKLWLDVENMGNITGSMAQLGDLSTGAYVLAMKNYATTPGGATGDQTDGLAVHDTNIGVSKFGANDIVYFDSQVNNLNTQLFDGRYTQLTDGSRIAGGQTGQNTLVLGTEIGQLAGNAYIGLGLEGNTSNRIYPAVYTLDANSEGWANAWHNASAPLIMG